MSVACFIIADATSYSAPSLVVWKDYTGAMTLVTLAQETMQTHATSTAAMSVKARLGLGRGCTSATCEPTVGLITASQSV